MRPGQDQRIAHLFLRGYSLDLVSEVGLLYGWTRSDAKAVLADHGWALDWSGRLQAHHMKENVSMTVPVAHADPEHLLNAGIDHEDPVIRKAAAAAERALEKLRTALMQREAVDAEQAARQAASEAFGVILGVQVSPSGVRLS